MERLTRLSRLYRHERNINQALLPHFPGKTAKQISDKRRYIPLDEEPQEDGIREFHESDSSDEEEYEDAVEVSENGNEDAVATTVSDGNSVADRANANEQATHDRMESGVEEWANQIKDPIERLNVLLENDMSRLDRALTKLWQDLKDSPSELNVGLDKYISEVLTPGILGTEVAEHSKKAPQKRGPDRDKLPLNHNKRTRVSYARCQELFEHCPRRLADAAISGTFDFMEYRQDELQSKAIRDLYNDLWGTRAPVSYQAEVRPAVGINTFFSPITEEDVIQRITKISSSFAAGPDMIKEVHLNKKDLTIILAK